MQELATRWVAAELDSRRPEDSGSGCAEKELFMAPGAVRRKVLIIEDEPAIRNALYVLLAGLGCEGDVAYSGQQALSMIGRECFDAVLLDLRCSNLPAEQVVSEIKELRPNLVGRVLVITGEVTDPQTLELIERHCLPHVSRSRLMQELWIHLRSLLGMSASHGPAPGRSS